jgi:hypothetical protein
MKNLILAASISLAALTAAAPAHAFCGFYVAKADAKLFNKASKVVVARKGEATAVTMASDYQGDLKEFALVVPVPTVITREQISITENATVDHLDAYSAPRLVEYFDPDPCRANLTARDTLKMRAHPMPAAAPGEPARHQASTLGVKVEAEYTVGEYDIAILSAKESDGLTMYLNQEGYKIPEGAAAVLASYIKQDMKFFVARVNLKEHAKSGAQYLRPIQVRYDTAKFMLPIRLGTVNANGPQDMIVLMLTEKGRVETTNYRTVKVPSNVEIPIFAKTEFGAFYKAMFASQVKKDGQKAVYLEYAWEIESNAAKCDPCTTPLIAADKLVSLGATWIAPPQSRRQDPAIDAAHQRAVSEKQNELARANAAAQAAAAAARQPGADPASQAMAWQAAEKVRTLQTQLTALYQAENQRQQALMSRPQPMQQTSTSFITRLHVRYDATTFPEDLMFQETTDRSNFQGRYILRHPFTGEAKCSAGQDYARTLDVRFAQEAATMSTLTGWDIADIRKKMAANGQVSR